MSEEPSKLQSFVDKLERGMMKILKMQRMAVLKQVSEPIGPNDSVFGTTPAGEDGLPLVAPHQDVLIRVGFTTKAQPDLIQFWMCRTTAQISTQEQRADLKSIFEIGLRLAGGRLVTLELGIERVRTMIGAPRPAPVLRVVGK